MDALQAAPVTLLLLAANVLASFIAFSNPDFLLSNLLTTAGVRRGELHRLLTSGFLHGSGMHLFVNMLTLYYFGPVLEQGLGSSRFAIIYFLSLLAGSAWALVENWRNPNYAALGASGAISGLVLSFCILAPTATLGVFFILPMPAMLFAIAYILLSAGLSGRQGNRIAHEAHLGGALAGVVVTLLMVPGSGTNFVRELGGLFG